MSCFKITYDNESRCKKMEVVENREEYLLLRDTPTQRSLINQVRNGNKAAKTRLLQMNYSCLPNDDGTLKGATRVSTSVAMDIDHIAPTQIHAVKDIIMKKKDELGLLMLERSARGEGFHLAFRRRQEMS